MKMQAIEVWVRVNSEGEYDCGTDEAAASERFEESSDETLPWRFVKLVVTVPLPEVIEVSGEVSIEERPGELKAVVKG